MSNTNNGFENEPVFGRRFDSPTRSGVSSSVLLTAILCLVFVIVLITLLHMYLRYTHRRSHAQRRLSAHAQVHHVATHGGELPRPKTGLDLAVVASLPKFTYRKNRPAGDADECSVCLSQLEEGETVRQLPACGHKFHDKCIDMWLYSHNTCPLCRKVVGPVAANPPHVGESAVEVVVLVQVGGGANHANSHTSAVAQATSSGLLMPAPAPGCGNSNQGEISGHEDSGAPSRLPSFRRIFSLERVGGRRQQQQQQPGDDGLHHDLEGR